jgi:hypothetical protein
MNRMVRKKGPVFRVSGLLASKPDDELTLSLKAAIEDNLVEEEQPKPAVSVAIVPSCYNNDEKTALVEFHDGVPAFLSELVDDPLGDWQVEVGDTDINFDQHFFGFTQLYTPTADSSVTSEYISLPNETMSVLTIRAVSSPSLASTGTHTDHGGERETSGGCGYATSCLRTCRAAVR